MTPWLFRLSAGALWLTALAGALLALRGSVVGAWALARWLTDHGGPGYALTLGWVVAAPVLLAAALGVRRRTPWPWVVATTAHLLVLVGAAARLEHLMTPAGWALLATVVALGLASLVSAVPAPARHPGSAP